MTIEEYETKEKELESNYIKERNALARYYAIIHNPYKIGDIITDHKETIKIEVIKVYLDFKNPCCCYSGTILNKDLTPNKKNKKSNIYQNNIKTSSTIN